jgi:hypothetical protein
MRFNNIAATTKRRDKQMTRALQTDDTSIYMNGGIHTIHKDTIKRALTSECGCIIAVDGKRLHCHTTTQSGTVVGVERLNALQSVNVPQFYYFRG